MAFTRVLPSRIRGLGEAAWCPVGIGRLSNGLGLLPGRGNLRPAIPGRRRKCLLLFPDKKEGTPPALVTLPRVRENELRRAHLREDLDAVVVAGFDSVPTRQNAKSTCLDLLTGERRLWKLRLDEARR